MPGQEKGVGEGGVGAGVVCASRAHISHTTPHNDSRHLLLRRSNLLIRLTKRAWCGKVGIATVSMPKGRCPRILGTLQGWLPNVENPLLPWPS